MFAFAIAVAAITDSFPPIVIAILAIGTNKMAKRDAIIHILPIVETLGSTSAICTDKTGIFTQNKMTTVEHFFPDGNQQDMLLKIVTLCNDSNSLTEVFISISNVKGIKYPSSIALIK